MRDMLLALDVGNTNIVIGCVDGDDIVFQGRMETNLNKTTHQYAVEIKNILELSGIKNLKFGGSIISSVVPPVTGTLQEAVRLITATEPMVVGPGIKTGLNITIDNPAQLGSDLVVDAVAAIKYYKCPLVVIDMGTATTVSVVDKNQNYIGGMIFPGVMVSQSALTSRTSQLPKISLSTPPKKIIGKNTVDCMKSGAIFGNAAMFDAVVDRISEEIGEKPTVIATGGTAKFVIPYCKSDYILDGDLLIKGLKIIYDKNKN